MYFSFLSSEFFLKKLLLAFFSCFFCKCFYALLGSELLFPSFLVSSVYKLGLILFLTHSGHSLQLFFFDFAARFFIFFFTRKYICIRRE